MAVATEADRLEKWPASLVPRMRRLALDSFWFFAREIAGLRLLEDAPHKELCEWCEQPHELGMVLMPRGSYKSVILTEARPLWMIARNPNTRILLDAALRANAKKFLGVVKWHLDNNERFIQLFGDLHRDPGWTEDFFTVKRGREFREPTIQTSGIDQVVVSQHFNRITADDLVNDTNINSPEMLQKTYDHINVLGPLLEPPSQNPEYELMIVGTRWHDADAYGQIIRREANTDDDGEIMAEVKAKGKVRLGRLDLFHRGPRRFDGKPLFSIFTDDFLAEKRRTMGNSLYAANYENDPVPAEDAVFQRSWFLYFGDRPGDHALPGVLDTIMMVDPAFSEKQKSDDAGIFIFGLDQLPEPSAWILHTEEQHGTSGQLIARMIELARRYRPDLIEIETHGVQEPFLRLVQYEFAAAGLRGVSISGIKPENNESKDARIRSAQPYWEQGRVKMRRGMNRFEQRLVRYPKGSRRDLLDAMGYGLRRLRPEGPKRGRTREYIPDDEDTGY